MNKNEKKKHHETKQEKLKVSLKRTFEGDYKNICHFLCLLILIVQQTSLSSPSRCDHQSHLSSYSFSASVVTRKWLSGKLKNVVLQRYLFPPFSFKSPLSLFAILFQSIEKTFFFIPVTPLDVLQALFVCFTTRSEVIRQMKSAEKLLTLKTEKEKEKHMT